MINTVERELERVLTLLRNKIRERGFTQLEVQEALGWGRSYISQLLTKQKSLRIEQVLLILNVIGVDPSEFFGELYQFSAPGLGHDDPWRQGRYASSGAGYDRGVRLAAGTGGPPDEELQQDFREMRSLLRGLLRLLSDRGIVEPEELNAAVSASTSDPFVDDKR